MLEKLKKNLEQEKKIVKDMRLVQNAIYNNSGNNSFYHSGLNSLIHQLVLLNDAVPELLRKSSPVVNLSQGIQKVSIEKKKIPVLNSNRNTSNSLNPKTISVNYVSPSDKEKRYITINKKDKDEFLKKLKISEQTISSIGKTEKMANKVLVVKPSSYARFSNRFFRNISDKFSPQFGSLKDDLKKANIRFLLSSYLSMTIMSMLISFFVGIFFVLGLLVLGFSNWLLLVLPFGLSGLVLSGFYLYPASEANSVKKNISHELPFATIYMTAIAISDIAPIKIFKIIMSSPDYPNIGKEIRKVIAQVDIYGYDLVTSLKNVAVRTSNPKLADLFSGLATNISTGGALKNYLNEMAKTFLVGYRLERHKYTKLAGTFMDVYISILIAAPLILMMMFIIMNAAGLGLWGMGIGSLLMISVIVVIVVNIIFIVVLNAKQPKV